jgi:hypothetical protein
VHQPPSGPFIGLPPPEIISTKSASTFAHGFKQGNLIGKVMSSTIPTAKRGSLRDMVGGEMEKYGVAQGTEHTPRMSWVTSDAHRSFSNLELSCSLFIASATGPCRNHVLPSPKPLFYFSRGFK